MAQSRVVPVLQIGAGLSATAYAGDFSDETTRFQRIYPGANLSIQMENLKSIQLQMNVGFGKFADQYDVPVPNPTPDIDEIRFIETSFFYGDLRLKYRFLKESRIQPFLSAGAGVLVFSPKDQDGKPLEDAAGTRPEGENYNTIIPQIPGSAGVQLRINPTVLLSLSYTYRFTPTDYLDNVGQLGRKSGFDAIHTAQLSVLFLLGDSPSEQLAAMEENEYEMETPLNTVPSGFSDQAVPVESTEEERYEESTAYSQEIEPIAEPELIPEPKPEPEPEPQQNSDPNLVQGMTLEVDEYGNVDMGQPVAEKETDWISREKEAIAQNKFFFYEIQVGDSLEELSRRYKIQLSTLKKENFLKTDEIKVGSYLRIPEVGIPHP